MANTLSTRMWVMFLRHLSNIGETASLKVTVACACVMQRLLKIPILTFKFGVGSIFRFS